MSKREPEILLQDEMRRIEKFTASLNFEEFKERDIIIHGYFGVDPEIIWDVVKRKIPELKEVVEIMLAEVS